MRGYIRFFESIRETAFSERKNYQLGNRWQEDIKTILKIGFYNTSQNITLLDILLKGAQIITKTLILLQEIIYKISYLYVPRLAVALLSQEAF